VTNFTKRIKESARARAHTHTYIYIYIYKLKLKGKLQFTFTEVYENDTSTPSSFITYTNLP